MTSTPHNHTDTSRSRAEYLDESGTSQERAQAIRSFLASRESYGATSKEYAAAWGFDSLPTWVTGAFSTLHEAGHIVRINERRPKGRGSAYVYVDPRWVGFRDTVPFKSNEGITQEDREIFRAAVESVEKAESEGRNLQPVWKDLARILKRLS